MPPGRGRHLAGRSRDHVGRGLDENDAGRFQRFEETAREPDRHAILHPVLLAPPDAELQLPHRKILRAARTHVVAQHAPRRGIAIGVARAVHVSHAAPRVGSAMSQVHPASCAVEIGVRRNRDVSIFVRHLHGHRAIDEQHVALGDEGHTQCTSDELGAKAGAIDVQTAAVRVPCSCVTTPAIAPASSSSTSRHGADDVPDAQTLREPCEIRAEAARVQVIGIVHGPAITRVGDRAWVRAPRRRPAPAVSTPPPGDRSSIA